MCVFLFLKSCKLMDLGDNVKRICMTSLQISYWKSYRWIQKWFSQKYIFSKNPIEFKNYFLKLFFLIISCMFMEGTLTLSLLQYFLIQFISHFLHVCMRQKDYNHCIINICINVCKHEYIYFPCAYVYY